MASKKPSGQWGPGEQPVPKTPEAAARMRGAKGSGADTTMRDPALRRARAEVIIAKRIAGVPRDDIARQHQISTRMVAKITKWAEETGIVDSVRERMKMELLPKAEGVYREILDAPAEMLADRTVQKGHELKLKAARHIADGLGAFRKEERRESRTLDLQGYLDLRQSRLADGESAGDDGSLVGGDGGADFAGGADGGVAGLLDAPYAGMAGADAGRGGGAGGGGLGEADDDDGDVDAGE